MIKTLRSWFMLGLFAVFLINSANAGETEFTQSKFDDLLKSGAAILVSVHADWCPTCRAQAPIIEKMLGEEAYKDIHALRVDFDTQQDVVKAFGAFKQSTLIVFKAGREVGRSLGDTSPEGIKSLLDQAL